MTVPTILSRIGVRLHAGRHKAYARLLSGILPYYVVNEFPKSGGTWLSQMLADALDLPFPRNAPLRPERSVVHGHFLSPLGLRNVVVLWRDPRDVIISLYHHCYFINEHHNALLVALMKQRLPFEDYRDVSGNLPDFIRFVSTSPISPKFTWPQFAAVWAKRSDVVHVTYEALRNDTPAELRRVVAELTDKDLAMHEARAIAKKHSLERAKAQAATVAGKHVEMSFVREGSVGGGRRYFSEEAEIEWNRFFGKMPSVLGYR